MLTAKVAAARALGARARTGTEVGFLRRVVVDGARAGRATSSDRRGRATRDVAARSDYLGGYHRRDQYAGTWG